MSGLHNVAANVRRFRLELRFSQAEIGRRIERHPSVVSQVERGLIPDPKLVAALAAALDVPEKACYVGYKARPGGGFDMASLEHAHHLHQRVFNVLLDELDATFKGDKERAENLRGILNGGYRRGGKYTVCEGQGKITVRDCATFCTKALAGLGELPDTLADRSIQVTLQRRTTDEPCEKWRERDGRRVAAPLYDHLAMWAAEVTDTLREARP